MILAISSSLRRDSINPPLFMPLPPRRHGRASRSGSTTRRGHSRSSIAILNPSARGVAPPAQGLRGRYGMLLAVLEYALSGHMDRQRTHEPRGSKRQGGGHGANEAPPAARCRLAYSMTEVNMNSLEARAERGSVRR